MKKKIILCCSLFCLCSQKPEKDPVSIVVNSEKIRKSMVEKTAAMVRNQIVSAFPEKSMANINSDIYKSTARQLIANVLLVKFAQDKKISIDSVKFNEKYEEFKKQFGESFQSKLVELGETEASAKEKMKESVLIDSVIKQIVATLPPVDTSSYLKFYEENKTKYVRQPRLRASIILLPVDSSKANLTKEKVLAQANSIINEVNQGAAFEKMVKKYSKGPAIEEGGDIGWINLTDLQPEMGKALQPLKVGQISSAIESSAGIQIIKKTGEEATTPLPYSEVKEHVYMAVQYREKSMALAKVIDSLISKANIVYKDTSLTPSKTKDLDKLLNLQQ